MIRNDQISLQSLYSFTRRMNDVFLQVHFDKNRLSFVTEIVQAPWNFAQIHLNACSPCSFSIADRGFNRQRTDVTANRFSFDLTEPATVNVLVGLRVSGFHRCLIRRDRWCERSFRPYDHE